MTAQELLTRVRGLGILLWPSGDRLLYRPVDAVDPDTLADLAAHKAELLELFGKPVSTSAGRGRLVAELPERAVVALEEPPGHFAVFLPGEVSPSESGSTSKPSRSVVH